MSTTHLYSSPVGGITIRNLDFAPSIIFATLFALLIPLFAKRLLNKRSITTNIFGAGGVCLEKAALFTLRAVFSSNSRYANGITVYMQDALAIGVAGLIADLSQLLRCTLVNSTYTPASFPFPAQLPPSLVKVAENDPFIQDQPRRRYWFRRFQDSTWIFHIPALVLGIWGNTIVRAQKDGVTSLSERMHGMRLASSALLLFLIVSEATVTLIARFRLSRVNKRALDRLIIYYLILAIPQIYRLCILHRKTPSIFLLDTNSNNTPLQKAMFYLFHVLPEWVVCVMHLGVNAKEYFECRGLGDFLGWDENEKQKQKRLEKEQKRREKKEKKRVKSEAIRLEEV